MSQGKNVGLLVELQAEPAEEGLNLLLTIAQVLLVGVDEQEVIHVPDVILYPKALLHEMVELVQEQQGQELGCLVAEGQPIRTCVDVNAHEPENAVIYHLLS